MKTFHFVKHIGIDIKAENISEAIASMLIAEKEEDRRVENMAYNFYNIPNRNVEDVHVGYAEYAGYTEDVKDSEKRLYDYLADNDTPPKKTDYVGKIVIALRG